LALETSPHPVETQAVSGDAMSETLTTAFFNDDFMRDNRQDVARARCQTFLARAELIRMSDEQFATAMANAMCEAEELLVREN
jgi:hypothetical protein